ncbi:glycosyltransferase [Arthrobacter sp. RAF14]|uniref:glycosyltransferase n=1 Tax=Arthrobacter sp. RAF14 TaxID=3233051 RepID=UPI003F927F02
MPAEVSAVRPLVDEKNPVFVSWIDFHGRSEGIARRLGIEEWAQGGGNGPVPLRYLRLWAATWKYLRRKKPTEVIVMQPPVVALLAVRAAVGRNVRICGDLHTGTFYDPKWKWSTKLVLKVLKAPNISIVTNDALAAKVRSLGSEAVVLHDLIESYEPAEALGPFEDPALESLLECPYVLVPITYSYDEPLDELAAATHRTPGVRWVFTGRPPASFVEQCDQSNTVFPGFVSREEYLRLLAHANILLAPTTEEDTMQRAGYEAMCAGKALVTSDTAVLRDFFADAALTVPPKSERFAAAVLRAAEEQETFEGRMKDLKVRREQEQEDALARLVEWINEGKGNQ